LFVLQTGGRDLEMRADLIASTLVIDPLQQQRVCEEPNRFNG